MSSYIEERRTMKSSINKINPRALGAFLIFQSLFIWVPLIVMGKTINWPASLSEPASVNLPAIVEHALTVKAGYFSYLVYSILFFPLAYFLSTFAEGERIESHFGIIAVGFAALSTLARCFGIIRWLTAMPILAAYWMEAQSAELAALFDVLNAFAGGLGEIVGVGMFAGFWAVIVNLKILSRNLIPAWLGVFGLVSGLAVMAPTIELFNIDLGGFISITTALIHIWWLLLGIYLIVKSESFR